jgi:hypothetical protein
MSKEEKTTETNNGDSLLEARARVDTLEVDLRRQLQEAQSNDVNTLKTTEQLHPLIMTRSDRNHHRWRYAEGGEDVPDLAGDDDGLPVFKFKKDIFSFLYCYKWYQSQFIFAFLIVMGIQTVMMVLLLVSNIAFEDRTNPIQVPGNVGHAVRATQLLALLVAVFYVDDFRDGIEVSFCFNTITRSSECWQSVDNKFAFVLDCFKGDYLWKAYADQWGRCCRVY